MSDTEPKLTHEAKEAIRSYLLTLVTPPALILSLITFLVGYSIKDVAATKAELEVMERAMDALAQATRARDIAKDAADYAEKLGDRLDTASRLSLSKADDLVSQLTESLLKNPSFKNDIERRLASDYARPECVNDFETPSWFI